MPLRILHLSDLHRDPRQPLGNGPLLQSLLQVVDQPGVTRPDLIVVSGDVVYGIPPKGDLAVLQDQYSEAEGFLGSLADHLLNGDRSRLIVVPGNHDVALPTFHAAISEVPVDSQKWASLKPKVLRAGSEYRWSWDDRTLHRIVDPGRYLERLGPFSDFYERFYQGTRSYSLDPAGQFDVFDFADLDVTVVGFSSCYGNDTMNRVGDIHPDAVASVAEELRKGRYAGRLLIATWHHSVSAPPQTPDYMDEEQVQVLLSYGFSLGLHGHQHRAEGIHTRSRFGRDGHITVVSAGTLCAGAGGLPAGRPRSFNLLELDASAGRARLRVCRMINDHFGQPLWDSAAMDQEPQDLPLWTRPGYEVAVRRRIVSQLSDAEELLRSGSYGEAADLLETSVDSDGRARRLFVACLAELEAPERTLQHLDPPQSAQEQILVMDALWATGERVRLRALLQDPAIANSTDPAVREIRDLMVKRVGS